MFTFSTDLSLLVHLFNKQKWIFFKLIIHTLCTPRPHFGSLTKNLLVHYESDCSSVHRIQLFNAEKPEGQWPWWWELPLPFPINTIICQDFVVKEIRILIVRIECIYYVECTSIEWTTKRTQKLNIIWPHFRMIYINIKCDLTQSFWYS